MGSSADWYIPDKPARTLLCGGGLRVFPLKTRAEFAKFCKERDINVTVERLIDLEALGIVKPIVRLCPPSHVGALVVPLSAHSQWFRRGWALETFARSSTEGLEADGSECYYSIFQIFELDLLSSLTLSLSMEAYLLPEPPKYGPPWPLEERIRQWAGGAVKRFQSSEYRAAVAWLCQYISDRYGPHASSDMRTIQVPSGSSGYWSRYISLHDPDWDWQQLRRSWNAKNVAGRFGISVEMLRQAYEGIAATNLHGDPIDLWYPLVQFIRFREREKLKGEALRAETLRHMLVILGKFYEDICGEEVRHPHEVARTVVTPFPEIDVRDDPREHLEYVANRFGVNPRPSVALFVEGESEEVAIKAIFEKYFGAHPGKYFIELINLHGVDTATGGRRDRFRAILRLVDYLHHHQTLCFLLLDNENQARRLKEEARRAASIHTKVRTIMRPERIKIWGRSFEFDNFSDTEIALALTEASQSTVQFTAKQVSEARTNHGGDALSECFSSNAGRNLNKPMLASILVDQMFKANTRRRLDRRPIVKVLERVITLAARNPPPTLKATWEKNQASRYIGKKR